MGFSLIYSGIRLGFRLGAPVTQSSSVPKNHWWGLFSQGSVPWDGVWVAFRFKCSLWFMLQRQSGRTVPIYLLGTHCVLATSYIYRCWDLWLPWSSVTLRHYFVHWYSLPLTSSNFCVPSKIPVLPLRPSPSPTVILVPMPVIATKLIFLLYTTHAPYMPPCFDSGIPQYTVKRLGQEHCLISSHHPHEVVTTDSEPTAMAEELTKQRAVEGGRKDPSLH